MDKNKKLLIIDSSSLIYRAFYALPPLTDKNGRPTGAIYGFLLTLFKAIKDTRANFAVACFDVPRPTFRHRQFEEYKAHRPPTPEGIISQISQIKEVLKAFSIPIFEKEGFEADDVIATIAEKAKKENVDIYIVSGDMDNLQLVGGNVRLYTLGKNIKETIIYDEKKVKEKFGVRPDQMNDFKAMTGDVSDNIPGVPGIGKTTAADIIQRFGSLDALYLELATDTAVLKPKVKEMLKQNKDKAFLSLSLVKAKKDVDLNFDFEACRFGGFDKNRATAILNEMNFATLINRIGDIVFN